MAIGASLSAMQPPDDIEMADVGKPTSPAPQRNGETPKAETLVSALSS
jgi:hypothetical protein